MAKIKPFNTGYFSIHNVVFDVMMPTLSPNAFKVLCVAIRQTMGWRKKREAISYSQFMALSGIKSRATVSTALAECLAQHYLIREESGNASNLGTVTYRYHLNTELEVEYPDSSTEIELEPSTDFELEADKGAPPSSKIELGPSTDFELGSLKIEPGPSLNFEHTTIHKEHHHDDDGSALLTTTQQTAAAALEAQGVTRSVAARLATRCAPELIAGWIAHVETRAGLKSPPAFLVAVLKRGDPPPVAELALDDPRRYVTGAYADLIQH